MPVRVLKNQSTFLANPVTFKLTPLTVAAAQSRGIIGDFPDDEISPNRARKIAISFADVIDSLHENYTHFTHFQFTLQRRQISMDLY